MQLVSLIPARAGSKRLPGKNTKLFCGHSLVDRAIGLARRLPWEYYVTTDIKTIVGPHVLRRSAELAEDDTPMFPVLKDATVKIRKKQPGVTHILLLQPTSPLRDSGDAWSFVRNYIETSNGFLTSAVASERLNAPPAPNGTFYLIPTGRLEYRSHLEIDTYFFWGPANSSIDIDTQEDWDRAERAYRDLDPYTRSQIDPL